MEEITKYLLSEGTLGVLSLILLISNVIQGKVIQTLFGHYKGAQDARIAEALKFQETAQELGNVVDNMKTTMRTVVETLIRDATH